MNPGDRVRFNRKCVWPERVGLTGVVVHPPADGKYPQPARAEVLVLLDDDPLALAMGHPTWSCVTSVGALDLVSEDT